MLTGILGDEIYTVLDENSISRKEQERCLKKSRGTKDALFKEQQLLQEVKKKREELQNITLKMFRIPDNIVGLVKETGKLNVLREAKPSFEVENCTRINHRFLSIV